MSRRTSRRTSRRAARSRRRTSRGMRPNVLLLANAPLELSKRIEAAQKYTQGMTPEEISSDLKEARRDYTRLLRKIGALRASSPSDDKLLRVLRSKLAERADEIKNLMAASGEWSEEYDEYVLSPRGARGLPSAKFKAWSMKPNVLLLANEDSPSSSPDPRDKRTPEQVSADIAAARREYTRVLRKIGALRAENRPGTGKLLRKLNNILDDLRIKITYDMEKIGQWGPGFDEYLSTSRAARDLPSAKFKAWSMKPNVLLLPNENSPYEHYLRPPDSEISAEEVLRMGFIYDKSALERALTDYRKTGNVSRLAFAVFLLGSLKQLESSYYAVHGATARQRESISANYDMVADRLFGEMNKVGWNWR